MQILSHDAKQLTVNTESGSCIFFLPIGIKLEEALEVSKKICSMIEDALEKYNKEKEEGNGSQKSD